MKKKFLRLVALSLVFSILLGSAAFAVELRASQYISDCYASISPQGNGSINIYFNITATGMMDDLGSTKIVLKTYRGTTVKTYNYTSYPNMMSGDNFIHASSVSYSGTAGMRYYAIVTFSAGDSTGSDTTTYTTATVAA